MAQSKRHNFIVIDDSRLDSFIAEKVIRNTGACDDLVSFLDATMALEFLTSGSTEHKPQTVILVDIQMPVMNGFQFVEAFEELPESITANYAVFVISSSINEADLDRVHNYACVRQFLNKPLNSNVLGALLQQL